MNTVQSADLVARLSQDSGAEVIYRTDLNRFEITGVKEQIQSVVQIIRGLPISQVSKLATVFDNICVTIFFFRSNINQSLSLLN